MLQKASLEDKSGAHADLEKLVSELSIYQTELQMQNSELQQKQIEIQRAKDKYFFLFNLAPVAYFIIKDNLQIEEVNKIGARMLGEQENILKGRKFTNFVSPDSQDNFYMFLRNVQKSNLTETCEIKLVNFRGEITHVHVDAVSRNIPGDFDKQIFIAITDISRRLQNEKSLRVQNDQLMKLNHEMDKFTYSTSHDMRAPLASVLGLINLYRITAEEKDRSNYVDLIEKTVRKLDIFVHEILQYSRNAKTQTNYEKIDLRKLFNEILITLASMEHSDSILKTIEIKNEEVPFYSDWARLTIIMNNLISNSIKYCRQESIFKFLKVVIDINTITTIKVIDNGIGIEKKHLPNVFDMFYRATDKNYGSGLGLYLVKEAVHKLEGKIYLKSTPGAGTEFVVEIPNQR